MRPARRRTSAVVTVAAAGAVLAGCAPAAAPPEQALVATPPAAPSSGAPSTSTATSAPTGSSDGGRCTTGDLDARLVVRPDELGAHRAAVVWTNRSAGTCTMYGFGGVDLDGPDQLPYGPVYHLPRADDRPETVTLAQGESAESVLNYLSPDDATGGWLPSQARVTPPDETQSVTLLWSFGAVTRQDGATRPGTFLAPVTTPPRPDATPCTADDVDADLAAGDAAAGNHYASLVLRGKAGHACSLAGPLPIVLQNAGKVVIVRDPIDASGSTVTVDGTHAASVRLHWTVASSPQVTPGAVTVRLPGTDDAVTVPWDEGPVDASEQHFSISAGPLTAG